MRCAAWLRLRVAGGAVQADDLPFAVRPFEDARRDAGAFDRLAIREDDRVVIGFGSDRDLAFAAHRDLIVLEGKGLERLQLGRRMMIAIIPEIPLDAARLKNLAAGPDKGFGPRQVPALVPQTGRPTSGTPVPKAQPLCRFCLANKK